MSDIDLQTSRWLSTLKLGQKLQYLSDFQNGYYFGTILQKMNLSKGKKFKNSKDMACKFQNFKNVRDLLLENFKVDFPIQNILYNTAQLLRTLRDCCIQYNKDKKEATLRKIQGMSETKISPHEEKILATRQRQILSSSKMNQTGKFPRKIQEIQQKLQKYREIKTKHELFALEDRRRQLEDSRRMVQDHRNFQLNKLRSNHEFMKQQERKVHEVWLKTEQIKQARIQKDSNLYKFLEEKKNKFYESSRNDELKHYQQGMQSFQLNCIRQGIQLQHDPDKPKNRTEEDFNKQVVMERIKDNIKIHEKERKERMKRENKKAVDAKEANLKSQVIWNQTNLLQDYAKKINVHLDKCNLIRKQNNRVQAEKETIKRKYKDRQFTELPSNVDEQLRQEELRRRRIIYLDEKVERLERRQKKHKIIAESVLEALVHTVIANEGVFEKNGGFSFSQWKKIEKDFLGYVKKERSLKDQSQYIDSSYDRKVKDYINSQNEWQQTSQNHKSLKISQVLNNLIDLSCPSIALPEKPQVPLYMPLKVTFVGDTLSGKTTLSSKIAAKYGLVIINPQAIINQAFELNKEPIPEDPKKKKEAKKPQEDSPQKLALKEWGEKLMKKLDNPKNASIENYIEAIKFKLNYFFENKKGSQILQEFQQAKQQQTQRFSKALKDFQQVQKKAKKDSKKGGIPQSDQPPTQKKYFYTKGFVVDGIDLSLQSLKLIQKQINGYVSSEERFNQKAADYKQKFSNIITLPRVQKDNKLYPGTFDLLVQLSTNYQILEGRNAGRKTDPQTQIIYHAAFNPAPTDVKGLAERLVDVQKVKIVVKDRSDIQRYYSGFGDDDKKRSAFWKIQNQKSIDEILQQINRIIEINLQVKYQSISNLKSVPLQPNSQKVLEVRQTNTLQQILRQVKLEQSKSLIDRFNDLYDNYVKKITQSFYDFDFARQGFGQSFLAIQQNFINIINRPDDKAGKILSFQQNYNKLLSQKTNIVKDSEASKHLISKLDELYDGLWTSLEAKKNQAVAERKRTLQSNWINQQIQKIVEIAKNVIENELTLLVEIIFFVLNVNESIRGNYNKIPTEYLVLGIPPELEPISSFDQKSFGSDRLDYYSSQAQQCLRELPNWLKKREKKYKIQRIPQLEQVLNEFIQVGCNRISLKIKKIRQNLKEIYLEYNAFFRILVNKMDDWIIQGIKSENQFVYDIYKNIKKNIQDVKKSLIRDLFVRQITESIHPVSALPPNKFSVVEYTDKNAFKIFSFVIFLEQIRCLSNGGRIPFRLFRAYFEKRKKSQLLQEEFLKLQFDLMQQYLVTDDYCNYREVGLAILLWNIKIIDEDSLTQYQKKLTGDIGDDQQGYRNLKTVLRYQQFQVIQGQFSSSEERILKPLLFQIFRGEYDGNVDIKEYIETLRLFVQLQVFKYGDTLMMLHEAGQTRSH